MRITMSALAVVTGLVFGAGCGSSSTSNPPAPKLTLTLDASLDGGGDVKATSFTKLELVSPAGTVLKTATASGTAAAVDLGGVTAGDYFLRVNDLADDLVPTRIDDPSKDMTQFVGTKLRHNVVGPDATVANATYNIKTFSKGQLEHQMVKYSDGTAAPPERYDYAIVSLKTAPPKIEIRLLGTDTLVLSYSAPGSNPHSESFADWILGGTNHGKPANYTSDAACNTCHGSLDAHPGLYANVTANNGWCFKCHYSKGGDPNGFVDGSFGVATPGTLTITLSSAQNLTGDTVQTTTFTSADLYDTGSFLMSHGAASGADWQFSLANIGLGDYFVTVNGITGYPVPVRIDDQGATVVETIAQTLRNGVIGNVASPTHIFKTYSQGNGEHPVVKFSDLSNIAPAEYAYVVVSPAATPAGFETRVLGTAAPLTSYAAASAPPNHGFSTWILGDASHGVVYNGVDVNCSGCHGNLDTKPATFTSVTPTNGWCYRCHASKVGDPDGMIDPAQ